MNDDLPVDLDDLEPRITFYTNGPSTNGPTINGHRRWLRRVWAVQCPETILFRDRCQGVAGHGGDHWCFRPDGSYHWSHQKDDPRRAKVACGTTPPGHACYRSPMEMSQYHYLRFHDDAEVTDVDEIARLERNETTMQETINRPCTEAEIEELRQMGRLDGWEDDRRRSEQARKMAYRIEDFLGKSTLEDIEARFNGDVQRFSNLETGQSATIDAPLAMQQITEAAIRLTPNIFRVLDIGCGAGNNTIKLREVYDRDFEVDLLDLSGPMLTRAEERVREASHGTIRIWREDFRTADLPRESFDVILAAAVLHHLRDDTDWIKAFEKIHALLRPGGSVWITDLVVHETGGVHEMMWKRYGEYLDGIGGADYRDRVFEYIAREDSPRSVTFQLELLRRVGFRHVELLHKNSCFAAFGGWKE